MTHVIRLTAPKYTAAVLVIALLIHVSSLTAAEPSVHSKHVAARPMADYDDRLGGDFIGPEDFLRLVYASLAKRL